MFGLYSLIGRHRRLAASAWVAAAIGIVLPATAAHAETTLPASGDVEVAAQAPITTNSGAATLQGSVIGVAAAAELIAGSVLTLAPVQQSAGIGRISSSHLSEWSLIMKITATNDLKLEVVVIPVSDVDRAKRFYSNLGWKLDAEINKADAFRLLQYTPPGSPGSIHFGKGVTTATPGSAQLYLVVSDIEAARAELIDLGVEVSEVFHLSPGEPAQSGPHPQRNTYSSYARFSDPDGNSWLLQEVTTRLPGRVSGDTTFTSPNDLAAALRRAAAAHGEHEKRNGGKHDDNWPEWYAQYLAREQSGKALPA